MLVKFEDMVNSPGSVIPRIAEFCEIEDHDKIVQYAEDLLDPTYRFEKRAKIDAPTSLILDKQIEETRQRFGYEFRENWL